jgi:hypothetical protein
MIRAAQGRSVQVFGQFQLTRQALRLWLFLFTFEPRVDQSSPKLTCWGILSCSSVLSHHRWMHRSRLLFRQRDDADIT